MVVETEYTLFRLPKNKKKIGQGTEEMDVYVEDYVLSFIHFLGKQQHENYGAAILLGNARNWEDKLCVFIYGVLQIPQIDLEKEALFSKEEWEEIYRKIEQNFSGSTILGWALLKTGISLEVTKQMERIHLENFPGEEKLMMLYEPLEQKEKFFYYRNKNMKAMQSYYLYYEKNQQMQEYMLSAKGNVEKEQVDQNALIGMKKKLNEMSEIKKRKKNRKKWIRLAVCLVGAGTIYFCMQQKLMREEVVQTFQRFSSQIEEKRIIGSPIPTQEEILPQMKEQSMPKVEEEALEKETTPAIEPTVTSGNQEISEADSVYYVVQKGDTLEKICKQQYQSLDRMEELKKENGIVDENKIIAGQKIKLLP